MITHTNFEPKQMLTFHWTAPVAGSGCVSLKLEKFPLNEWTINWIIKIKFSAHVFQTETVWFKDDGGLTKTICETGFLILKLWFKVFLLIRLTKKDEVAENIEIPTCCACGEAKYTLKFKGNWNQQTFPKDWPTNG